MGTLCLVKASQYFDSVSLPNVVGKTGISPFVAFVEGSRLVGAHEVQGPPVPATIALDGAPPTHA